jgi:UDP-N-acetylglucosamine diphosphorylase / glucose-1-phosphate thymidylyltransferase / UDP-N-acetylgalactosamine diphosphorylase / glucosamine-1-phosphate N-acetyltransferase / galactosamine-1-phosphate N-acetyltransferase
VFQQGFPPKFIPSFTWGGSEKDSTKFRLPKAIEIIKATMARRNMEMTELDTEIVTEIYNQ